MNNILLINNISNTLLTLNFQNNTCGDSFFEIIDKDKILVDNQIYYTNDSYLYFSDLTLTQFFKKIFLIHNEWNDSAIINLNNMTLKRLQHNDQEGKIIIENNKLIIDWNYWGKEYYNKIDNFTYVQENYNYEQYIETKCPIHIFIHICMIENWKEIFEDQIKTIKKSGLYDRCEKIHLGILGNNIQNIPFDKKFNILYYDSRTTLFEIHTINHIKTYCDNLDYEIYILYIHTKGVRKAGNNSVIQSWRKMMEYFLIEQYKICIDNLNIYDTLGNNVVNMYCYNKDEIAINNKHTLHYSGNFWWSKKSYIDKLNYLQLDLTQNAINTRFRAENWILSKYGDDNINIGIIFHDITNTHPYHRYVFDYYKELKIIIKKLMVKNI